MGLVNEDLRRELLPLISEQEQKTALDEGRIRCRRQSTSGPVLREGDRCWMKTISPMLTEEPSSTRPSTRLRRLGNGTRFSTVSSTVEAFRNMVLAILLLGALVIPTQAAFVNFQNCLSPQMINSPDLQFVPLFVNAVFDATGQTHNLNITVYGNVSIIATPSNEFPPPNSSAWTNTSVTAGKITDESPTNPDPTYSTLFTIYNVLSFIPYKAPATRFCNTTIPGTQCPIAPRFFANASNPATLAGFSVAHELFSSYTFTTINPTISVKTGDVGATVLACITANVTPDLGGMISGLLTYLPALVLLVTGIATMSAAIYSPWGSLDIFKWTSNFGRDEDLLRLVTPGFGDCLQYIQFIVLSGSLSLNYPGYYQPVVSKGSWSVLMFNESFVSHGNGSQSLVDGVYTANGTYGLDIMSQLVGMTADKDIWAGMMIWLLVIIAAVTVLIQIGFTCRWGYRFISNNAGTDLRTKNLPFSTGMVIRIVFNYLLLPIIALSMFQFVVANQSPGYTVGLAALTLVILALFTSWLLWLVASTRPRSNLFDDLPTVLLYGPLYNTYSDDAATFVTVPVILTFLRGIAIGAVQQSGIAQLVLLAICEVVLILTLNAFRPFASPTSMNFIHTVFASVRLLTLLLSVAFVPSLGVGNAVIGWIGYVILALHGLVLFIGFLLIPLQTLIEVVARLAGAGGEEGVGGGVARGGLSKVFGMRQLSRRNARQGPGVTTRNSIASDAAMLGQDHDRKSENINGGRSRSMSGSSAMLLNRRGASDGRRSMALDSMSGIGGGHSHAGSANGGGPHTPTTPGATSAFSFVPGVTQASRQPGSPREGIVNLKQAEAADPYYRPPRPRRVTMDLSSPGKNSRGSWASGDWSKRHSNASPDKDDGEPDLGEGPSISGGDTPLPAHLGGSATYAESYADEPGRAKTDYAIREVDFYYGVRGPALSNMPTRRLKTGPADPTGPVASASGWFKNLFGGKTKDKGKGFEVVRSARAPYMGTPPGEIALADQKPYLDDPESDSPVAATIPVKDRELELEDEGDAVGGGTRHLPVDQATPVSSEDEDDEDGEEDEEDVRELRSSQISQFAPSLPEIETGGDIELPSRIGSRGSRSSRMSRLQSKKTPAVPRKSSKRNTSRGTNEYDSGNETRLSVIEPSPPSSPRTGDKALNFSRNLISSTGLQPTRLPFQSNRGSSRSNKRLSIGTGSDLSDQALKEDTKESARRERPKSSNFGSYSSEATGNPRPSSIGYVQQYRASDNVHIANPSDTIFQGASAELVDATPSPEASQLLE